MRAQTKLAAVAAAALTATLTAPAFGYPGQLDPAYGTLGIFQQSFGTGVEAAAVDVALTARDAQVALVPLSGPFTGGTPHASVALVGLAATGVPDRGFGIAGIARPFGDRDAGGGFNLTRRGDGRLVVVGSRTATGGTTGAAFTAVVAQVLPDGSPDRSFGTGGVVELPGGVATASAALAGGGTLVLGYNFDGSSWETVAWRLRPDGTPDTAFAPGGRRVLERSADTVDLVLDAHPGPSGTTILSGTRAELAVGAQDGFVARLTDGGDLDRGFAGTGIRLVPATALIRSHVATDGAVTVAGTGRLLDGRTAAVAVRLRPDGNLDPTFGQAGVAVLDVAGENTRAVAADVRDDGRVVLAGSADAADGSGGTDLLTVGLTPSGTLDGFYGHGGVELTPVGGDAYGDAIAEQSTGRLVVAGGTRPADPTASGRALVAGLSGFDLAPGARRCAVSLCAPRAGLRGRSGLARALTARDTARLRILAVARHPLAPTSDA